MTNRNHTLQGRAADKTVYLDGKLLEIEPSKLYHCHSDHFSWGHAGSGPAQLALAIFLKLKFDLDKYQRFKFEVLAGLPKDQDFLINFNLGSPWNRTMAIVNIRSYNKRFDEELLKTKTNKELVALVHPDVRENFAYALGVVYDNRIF